MVIVTAAYVYRLYRERLSQVNSKLAEVEAGRAAEYLEPLAVLLENMQVRTKVAGNWNSQWSAWSHTHWPFQFTTVVCISVFIRYLQRAVSGVGQAQVRLWDPGSLSALGGQEHAHFFHHYFVCMFASNITSVLLCVCAEWEAVALRHGTKWTGGENKKAGGRPTQHRYHIRCAEALRHVSTSTLY